MMSNIYNLGGLMAFTVNNKQVSAPAQNKKKIELATGGQIRCVVALIRDKVIKLPFSESFTSINGKNYTLEFDENLDNIIYAPKFLLSLMIDKYGKK